MRKKLKEGKSVFVKAKQLPNGNYSINLNINMENDEEYLFFIELQKNSNQIDNEESIKDISLSKYLLYLANKDNQKISRRTDIYALLHHIKRYEKKEVLLKEVNKEYILGFLEYLKTAKQLHPKDEKIINPNTQAHYFRRLNYVLNYALTEELIRENPMVKILKEERPRLQKSKRNYLTIEEIKLLAKTDFYNHTLKRAFLFSCFCGLRYSDIASLTWGNLYKTRAGKVELRITQQKTQESITLPLSHEALKQLPKKKNTSNTEKVFNGLISLGRTNEILTRWACSAGIDKHITFHCARHTHATMMITLGADLYTVSKLLGHTNIQTTQIYAQIVDESKEKAINLIPDIT